MVTTTSTWSLLLLLVLFISKDSVNAYVSEEESLRTMLFTNYTNTVKPYQTTEVSILIIPLSLNELNIAEQRMSMTAAVSLFWIDWRLTWDPALYGNISTVAVQPDLLWTPVVVVENAVEDVGAIGATTNVGVRARLHHNGSIEWFPPMELSVSVSEVKIANYPFDTQQCKIRLIGWGELETEVNLTVIFHGVDISYYAANGEWDLIGTSTDIGYFYYAPGQNFKRVDFFFKFRRKWQFYGMNMVMPIVLTSILMCAVFALPIESGEKMGFSLTVLLSYVVFLTWVTENLPAISTDTSVLQVYLALVLCLGVLATLLTNWVLQLYHRDPEIPMSSAMRVFVSRVLALLCSPHRRRAAKRDVPRPASKWNIQNGGASEEVVVASEGNTRDPTVSHTNRVSDVREEQKEEYTWPEVAAMFDRFFMAVIASMVVVATTCILVILYINF